MVERYIDRRWNIYMIIISYFINNCVSGVVYDVYINYLQEIDIDIAKSFWGYYGYSMFISAFIITFINKIGYKKILFLSVGSCSIGLFGTFLLQSGFFIRIFILLLLSGIQLHYLILLPFINKYTKLTEQVKWFSRVYYIGYVGFFMTTYLGGYATIEFFSRVTNRTYLEAKGLSNSLDTMDSLLKSLYVTSMGRVILLLGIISLLGIIPLFFIKENREDYSEIREGNKNFVKDIFNKRREIFNRHSVLYLIYWGLNNFAIGLFVPYYTIYFNRYLNIDKVTTSLLLSLSYIAVVLFMFFTDTIAKLIGKVKTLYLSILLAIPFMILVAEGNRFGDSRIWIIGVALFIRTGIMNLGSPIDSSLAVEVVNEKMVPLYTGIISFITGIAGVLSGQFTGKILFDQPNGYKLGYYLGAGLYFIGALIIATNFSRFNKIKGE
ncbi:MFS transporter [Fusobacterium sp. SYSU M8D902]|uniref:MFS transporter n=1 Tax=Fusobacterium sp. SYSU M8D902 TaxID=3159562 RepID=UPI0032E49EEE